jgi:hypothetical protein
MKSAFHTRETAIRYLMRLDKIHSMRRDGSCACGLKRNCRSSEILSSQWIQNMIRKVEERDFEEQSLYGLWYGDGDADVAAPEAS